MPKTTRNDDENIEEPAPKRQLSSTKEEEESANKKSKTKLEKPGKGKVNVRHHESLATTQDMKEWPNGKELVQAMSKDRVQPKQEGDAAYWQAAVRWSLLLKYGVCPKDLQEKPYKYVLESDSASTNGDLVPRRSIHFSSQDIETIRKLWQEQCELASNNNHENDGNDLTQFLRTATSNGRPLQWSFLDCGPACRFKLHAHPNLEVIYCVSGALHEIRMEGLPVTKTFEKEEQDDAASNHHLKGPDLSSLGRPWKFATLVEGDWLVNEVGSIHRSFCATKGEGCLLFVLWGGSHADVAPDREPKAVSIQNAMDSMDQRLCDCVRAGSDDDKWEAISETFLPESEKSQ